MKKTEEEEILKIEKLKQKEQEEQRLKYQSEQKLKEELTSRIEAFEINKTKKN